MMAKKKTNKFNAKVISLIIAIILVVVLIGLVGYTYIVKNNQKNIENPEVTMEVENFGTIKLELYPDVAPNTVANFVALANNGFYDGTTYSRVVKDFMIQGGGAKATTNEDGTENKADGPYKSDIDSSIEKNSDSDAKYCIPGEFLKNNYNNTLSHQRGVISMARADYTQASQDLAEEGYNSASSEFFIMTKTTANLNGNYAAFGRVTEGMDVVDAISNVEVKQNDTNAQQSQSSSSETPVNEPVIKSIRVDTKGVDYGIPTTVTPFDYSSWLMQQYSQSNASSSATSSAATGSTSTEAE